MMRNLHVLPVRTARERRLFLTFPWRIYRNDPLWVPPLLPERRAQLDPQRGPFFKRGDAEFWRSTIRWMQKTQNLWQIPAAQEDTLISYLETNYNETDWGRRPLLPQSLMPCAP